MHTAIALVHNLNEYLSVPALFACHLYSLAVLVAICINPCSSSGLGWVSVGVKGPADLRVWVHEGINVTTHAAMLPDYARDLERPGFSSGNLKPSTKQNEL